MADSPPGLQGRLVRAAVRKATPQRRWADPRAAIPPLGVRLLAEQQRPLAEPRRPAVQRAPAVDPWRAARPAVRTHLLGVVQPVAVKRAE